MCVKSPVKTEKSTTNAETDSSARAACSTVSGSAFETLATAM